MLSNKERLEERIRALKSQETEEYQLERDENILRANYLSEIERLKKPLNLNWDTLAKTIKVSPSYLSQVFRGKKPLNFNTIAKIQKALNIRFEVQAVVLNKMAKSHDYEIKEPLEIVNAFAMNRGYTNTGGVTLTINKSDKKEFEKSVVYG